MQLPEFVYRNYPGDRYELLVMLALAWRSDFAGWVGRVSAADLSGELGISPRFVQQQLSEIKARGWVRIVCDEQGGRSIHPEYMIPVQHLAAQNHEHSSEGANYVHPFRHKPRTMFTLSGLNHEHSSPFTDRQNGQAVDSNAAAGTNGAGNHEQKPRTDGTVGVDRDINNKTQIPRAGAREDRHIEVPDDFTPSPATLQSLEIRAGISTVSQDKVQEFISHHAAQGNKRPTERHWQQEFIKYCIRGKRMQEERSHAASRSTGQASNGTRKKTSGDDISRRWLDG